MATRKKTAAKKSTKKAAKRPAARKTASKSAKSTTKKTAKKSAAKKATKKAAKKSTAGKKRAPNPSFMRPLTPSSQLAAVIGAAPQPRTQVISKLWTYIKKNDLQDSKNRRAINADDKLRPLFGGKNQITMFDLAKIANRHLS
jgi:upstream activation factor subunit UAF30